MSRKSELYRDPKAGRVAGVCAGVAEYFGIETWLVRIITVSAFFLLAAPFVMVSYIAAWFILDKKPEGYGVDSQMQSSGNSFGKGWMNNGNSASSQQVNTNKNVEVKTKVWQAGETPKQVFYDIQSRFADSESRLRKMETYVTSREFQLNREIGKL